MKLNSPKIPPLLDNHCKYFAVFSFRHFLLQTYKYTFCKNILFVTCFLHLLYGENLSVSKIYILIIVYLVNIPVCGAVRLEMAS